MKIELQAENIGKAVEVNYNIYKSQKKEVKWYHNYSNGWSSNRRAENGRFGN
jgi:hypothetical protein